MLTGCTECPPYPIPNSTSLTAPLPSLHLAYISILPSPPSQIRGLLPKHMGGMQGRHGTDGSQTKYYLSVWLHPSLLVKGKRCLCPPSIRPKFKLQTLNSQALQRLDLQRLLLPARTPPVKIQCVNAAHQALRSHFPPPITLHKGNAKQGLVSSCPKAIGMPP